MKFIMLEEINGWYTRSLAVVWGWLEGIKVLGQKALKSHAENMISVFCLFPNSINILEFGKEQKNIIVSV